jgi:hypothetical protein
VVLEQFVDQRELQTEVYRNGHFHSVALGKEHVMFGMIQAPRTRGAVDHHCFHSHIMEPSDFIGGACGIEQSYDTDGL